MPEMVYKKVCMCNVLESASILAPSESYWIVFDISEMVYNH